MIDGAIFDDAGNVEDTGRWSFGPLAGLLDTAVNVATDRLAASEAPKPQQTTQPRPVNPIAAWVPAGYGIPVLIGGLLVVVLFAVTLLRK